MTFFDNLLNGAYSATITEMSVLVREVRVRIGVLVQPVTIRIYYDSRGADAYTFELSAFMKTASDRDIRTTPGTAPSESEALRRAVRMLTEDYEEAVRRGELPEDRWLVQADRVDQR